MTGTPPSERAPYERAPAAALRASDAERDTVLSELAEHLKAGRLETGEFDDRTGLALRARTRGDLAQLLHDLPRLAAPAVPVTTAARTGLPFPLVAMAIFAAGTFVLGGISHAAAASGHPVWAVWWLWWLIPFAIAQAYRHRRRTGHQ